VPCDLSATAELFVYFTDMVSAPDVKRVASTYEEIKHHKKIPTVFSKLPVPEVSVFVTLIHRDIKASLYHKHLVNV